MQAMDAMLARLVGIGDKDQLQYVGNMNGCNHRIQPCAQISPSSQCKSMMLGAEVLSSQAGSMQQLQLLPRVQTS